MERDPDALDANPRGDREGDRPRGWSRRKDHQTRPFVVPRSGFSPRRGGRRARPQVLEDERGTLHPAIDFSFDELAALCLGERQMAPLAGTFLWEAGQSAFKKIRSLVGPKALESIRQFEELFRDTRVGLHDYSQLADFIEALRACIEESRAVHILYQSSKATEPAYRDVYPYMFNWFKNALYLVAFDPSEDKFKSYKLDRIEDVEETQFRFVRDTKFDAERFLEGSFGVYQGDGNHLVQVRFSATVARYVEEARWHASQRLTKPGDGTLLAEFRLSTTQEIKSWILSFGSHAVVLEPDSLRNEIISELERMSAVYSASVAGPAPVPRRKR